VDWSQLSHCQQLPPSETAASLTQAVTAWREPKPDNLSQPAAHRPAPRQTASPPPHAQGPDESSVRLLTKGATVQLDPVLADHKPAFLTCKAFQMLAGHTRLAHLLPAQNMASRHPTATQALYPSTRLPAIPAPPLPCLVCLPRKKSKGRPLPEPQPQCSRACQHQQQHQRYSRRDIVYNKRGQAAARSPAYQVPSAAASSIQ
jgi:hypothetical protein